MIKMKKIIIFLAFFASSQSLAQTANTGTQTNNNQVNNTRNVGTPAQQGSNVIASAPIPPVNAPKLTPQEKAFIDKNLAEHKDFQSSIKKLTPTQQKKFQNINLDFSNKMAEYNKILNDETSKISNIQNLIAIHSYISKGTLNVGDRALSKDQQDFYQKQITIYNKFSPDKKKLIKQALIKFRKNINALEKNRRQQFKILFKKDFENFKERESDEEIEKDSKL